MVQKLNGSFEPKNVTKRDYFAAAALNGLLANPVMGDSDLYESPDGWKKDISDAAEEFADEMIKVLYGDKQSCLDRRDANRYRKLREKHWSDKGMAVVKFAESVKLGHETLSGDRLDEALDLEIGEGT